MTDPIGPKVLFSPKVNQKEECEEEKEEEKSVFLERKARVSLTLRRVKLSSD